MASSSLRQTVIGSPRHLVQRAARASTTTTLITDPPPSDYPPPPPPGNVELYSYFSPSLTAGTPYTATVTQTIDPHIGTDADTNTNTDTGTDADTNTNSDPATLTLQARQQFSVQAPQYSLPAGSVHSVYPSPGYSAPDNILPHAVLSDPHLPWERRGSQAAETPQDRNRVPWLAVLSFTQDELQLTAAELTRVFAGTSLRDSVRQDAMGAVKGLPLVDVKNLVDTDSPIGIVPAAASETEATVILPRTALVRELFRDYEADQEEEKEKEEKEEKEDSSQQGVLYTTKYQYLAHVRNVNTAGMAEAAVEDDGFFSVVLGHRTGPLDNKTSMPVTCHLVSIEGVEQLQLSAAAEENEKTYVALASLYSWSYTCLPPNQADVGELFKHLGATADVLRPPPLSDAPSRMLQRLNDGFSLVRYVTQTGEQTVAFTQGPFTPTVAVVEPVKTVLPQSNSAQDLMVLDKQLGIMDITYATAWQLGRAMALADQNYTAALTRLRSRIHSEAMAMGKVQLLGDAHRSLNTVVSDLSDVVQALGNIHDASGGNDNDDAPTFLPGGPKKRWNRPALDPSNVPDLAFRSPEMQELYAENALKVLRRLAASADDDDDPDDPVVQEYTAVSADWTIVLAWVLDRYFLGGVPAHYYITDPSHLGPESLRFFSINPNWVAALVDGGLSLANHEGLHDETRVAIKKVIDIFINGSSSTTTTTKQPAAQIPRYGFLLRSDVVSLFPDLRVSTLPEPDPAGSKPGPLLRHEVVADGVMLGLLEHAFGSPDLTTLTLTQPPHQQRFALAETVDTLTATMNVRREYTVDPTQRKDDPDQDTLYTQVCSRGPDSTGPWFVWGTKTDVEDLRLAKMPALAKMLFDTLHEKMDAKWFDDTVPTAALVALQLNDPAYQLNMTFEDPAQPGSTLSAAIPTSTMSTTRARAPQPTLRSAPSPPAPESAVQSTRPPPTTAPITHLAPHLRALTPSSPPPRTTDSGQHPPTFTCTLTSSSTSYIRSHPLPQDLVFYTTIAHDPNTPYQLIEFATTIRLGTSTSDEYFLLPTTYTATAAPASMLANLRFNVLVASSTVVEEGNQKKKTTPVIIVKIVPRSANGWIAVESMQGPLMSDMSCVLNLVAVNPVRDGRGKEVLVLQTAQTYRVSDTQTKVLQGEFRVLVDESDEAV